MLAPAHSKQEYQLPRVSAAHRHERRAEPALHRLARLAAAILRAPAGVILAADVQGLWVEAGVGPDEALRAALFHADATGRDRSFLVSDASYYGRFSLNPPTGPLPQFRLCARMPLNSGDGVVLGSLCILFPASRAPIDRQASDALADVAKLAADELERCRRRPVVVPPASSGLPPPGRSTPRVLAAAYRDRGAFLASLSHEMRTPLNAIIGMSELIAVSNDGQTKNFAAEITGAGWRMLEIVEDILEYNGCKSGIVPSARAPFRLKLVLADALRMVRRFASKRGISLQARIGWDGAATVGDQRALKHVLLQLLTNAIKASRSGGEVAVGLDRVPGGRVAIEVVDGGSGLTAIEVACAFAPLGEALQIPGESAQFEGTGLSLPGCKAVVERHGGLLSLHANACGGMRAAILLDALEG